MKKAKPLSSRGLMASEDMAVALASLRNLITVSKSSESDEKLTDQQ